MTKRTENTILHKHINLWIAFCEDALTKYRNAYPKDEPRYYKMFEANKRVLEALLDLQKLTTELN